MTTINQITDAWETQITAADLGIRVYSEGQDRPNNPSALLMFRSRERLTECGHKARFSIEVSVAIGGRERWRALRDLHDFINHDGSSSIEAAIATDPTLGLSGVWCIIQSVDATRQAEFSDGTRVYAFMQMEVTYD